MLCVQSKYSLVSAWRFASYRAASFLQFCPGQGVVEGEMPLFQCFPIPAAEALLPGLHFKAVLAVLCRTGLCT